MLHQHYILLREVLVENNQECEKSAYHAKTFLHVCQYHTAHTNLACYSHNTEWQHFLCDTGCNCVKHLISALYVTDLTFMWRRKHGISFIIQWMYSKNRNNYTRKRKKHWDELLEILGQGKLTRLKVWVRAKAGWRRTSYRCTSTCEARSVWILRFFWPRYRVSNGFSYSNLLCFFGFSVSHRQSFSACSNSFSARSRTLFFLADSAILKSFQNTHNTIGVSQFKIHDIS